MLVFWTYANPQLLRSVLAPVMSGFGSPPKHRCVTGPSPLLTPDDVVVVMGERAVAHLREAGLVAKKATLSNLREKTVQIPGGPRALVSLDPYAGQTDPEAPQIIGWDVRLAHRLLTTGSLKPEVGKYRYVENLDDVVQKIEDRFAETSKPVKVSHDLETVGLHPYYEDRRIISSAWCAEVGTADVLILPENGALPSKYVMDQLRWLFASEKVSLSGTNVKFDNTWVVRKLGVESPRWAWDNCLVGSLLDENRSNSLNLLAKLFTAMGGYDDDFNSKYDKFRMDLVFRDHPEDFLIYAGGDVDADYRVRLALEPMLLRDALLARFYVRVLRPAVKAFERIEIRGIEIDVERMWELEKKLSSALKEWTAEAISMLPRRIAIKYADNLKLTRKAVLVEYLFGPMGLNLKPLSYTDASQKALEAAAKSGTLGSLDRSTLVPSTAHEHLQSFLDHPQAGPFVELLRKINRASKARDTYVVGFLKHLRPDGKFHPTYALYAGDLFDKKGDDEDAGTNTGRLSAKEPAVQTIPKRTEWAKDLRSCYVAPPGYTIMQADYDQGELKLIADQSGDATMLDVYRRGIDLHARTAAELNKIPFEEFLAKEDQDRDWFEKKRYGAKAGNFGLVYKISPAGFQEYAWKNYGLRFTMEECEDIHETFFTRLYPALRGWHQWCIEEARTTGMVRTPLGRIRHLPLIHSPIGLIRGKEERRAINSRIQATLSDLCIWSASELELQHSDLVKIFLMTHDSLAMYVRIGEEVKAAKVVKDVMENRPLGEFGWAIKLKMTVSIEVALPKPGCPPTLADLVKLEKFLAAA